jgi:uncharacterized SAM-binding protein YcdF (DUF218 family)
VFSSKYIFETRETKALRRLMNFFIYSFLLGFIYLISGYFFILFSQNQNVKAKETFFKSAPDLITIFTGDSGRIPFGIKLAKKYKQSNIFITGVYVKNSVDSLLDSIELGKEIDPNLLEIDHFARNTVENCLSTLRYLRQKKGFKDILIISHDYHLPRIKTIFSEILSSDDDFNFYYMGVESDYSNWRNLKILYTEVYKYIRTYAFLMIWDQTDTSKPDPQR